MRRLDRARQRGTAHDRQRGLDDAPPLTDVDLTRPSIARVYDHVLGGKDHYEIDRQVSAALFAAVPETSRFAKDNRDHLRRAVTTTPPR